MNCNTIRARRIWHASKTRLSRFEKLPNFHALEARQFALYLVIRKIKDCRLVRSLTRANRGLILLTVADDIFERTRLPNHFAIINHHLHHHHYPSHNLAQHALRRSSFRCPRTRRFARRSYPRQLGFATFHFFGTPFRCRPSRYPGRGCPRGYYAHRRAAGYRS